MANAEPDDRVVGRRIYRFESVTSTNDIARVLACQGAAEGTAVVAGEQTSGRGSRGRTWISEAGANLLLSVVMSPEVESTRISDVAFVAAVAVADYLIDDIGLQARVKWPNDVLVGNKKIGGILIEAALLKQNQAAVIVGIGLNVNWAQLPTDIAETATSIRLETGADIDVERVLQGVLNHLDSAYNAFADEGFEATLSKWKCLECSTGSTMKIESDAGIVEGLVDGIDSDGALLVRLADGSVERISAAGLIVAS